MFHLEQLLHLRIGIRSLRGFGGERESGGFARRLLQKNRETVDLRVGVPPLEETRSPRHKIGEHFSFRTEHGQNQIMRFRFDETGREFSVEGEMHVDVLSPPGSLRHSEKRKISLPVGERHVAVRDRYFRVPYGVPPVAESGRNARSAVQSFFQMEAKEDH